MPKQVEKEQEPDKHIRATAKKVVRILEEEIVTLNSVSCKKGLYGVRHSPDDLLNFRYGFICEDARGKGYIFHGCSGYSSPPYDSVSEIIMTFHEFDFYQIG